MLARASQTNVSQWKCCVDAHVDQYMSIPKLTHANQKTVSKRIKSVAIGKIFIFFLVKKMNSSMFMQFQKNCSRNQNQAHKHVVHSKEITNPCIAKLNSKYQDQIEPNNIHT